MRDLNWEELFRRPPEEADDDEIRPWPNRGLARILGHWEEWLTFAVVLTVFLSVVASVQQARWVRDMPALAPIALVGLGLGFLLSRVRVPEPLIHLFALPALCGIVLLRLLADLPGDTPRARFAVLLQRMHEWFYAAFHNGVSNDSLPVVMLVLVLIAVGAYLTAWSVFRWQNPWLGLVPGGAVILTNISYLPGQFSFAFVVFLFGAVLLLMRLHLTSREREWQRERTPYPGSISLSVFNATLWVAAAVLLLAWMMPLANRAGPLGRVWDRIYLPAQDRMGGLARVFNSVDAKKPITIHNFDDFLPFQGPIDLRGRRTEIRVEGDIPPAIAAYLRARAYDLYGAAGWRAGDEQRVELGTESGDQDVGRTTVTIRIRSSGNDPVVFSLGQPLNTDLDAIAGQAGTAGDVQVVIPNQRLSRGEAYTVTGSVATATEDQLRAAGDDYPGWTKRYLQLPDGLPESVPGLARNLTQYKTNAYDRAAAIEAYLRTYPVDNDVPPPPRGHDPVAYFLFEARRGYFDYHASAMVVLLRTLGIPARLAVGYALTSGARDPSSDAVTVDERSAFAWPEVYFPNYGWVEFNPTPSQPPIIRPGQGVGSDIPFDLRDELKNLDIPVAAGGFVNPAQPEDLPQYQAPAGGRSWLRPTLLALAALAGAVALAAGAGWAAWGYGLGGLDYPSQLWEKTVRLASLARVRPTPQQTPREFAQRLRAAAPDVGPVEALADAYARSRFGRKRLADAERASLEQAWKTVRGRLLRRVLWRGTRT